MTRISCAYDKANFLRHLYTLCDPDACYSFDDVIVVQDTRDGRVYAAHDAGCSCPTPFENHVFPTDFAEVRSTGDLLNYIHAVGVRYGLRDIDLALAEVRKALDSNVQRNVV